MATPKEEKSSSPPIILGRPLPVLTADMFKPTERTDKVSHADQDSDGGRQHTSSSLPRTKFTSKTPSSEREAISKLKTRMTFSDHSAVSSSGSTPVKNTNLSLKNREAATDPTSKRATSRIIQSAPVSSRFVQVEEKDDSASEGEIKATISIDDILSKLDSVKNYLREAESLHKQMQTKMAEPGALSQIEKLTKLIQELRQQEASYLAILLRLLDHNESSSQLDTTQEDSESESEDDEASEYSEDESGNEEDDPADETIISSHEHRPAGDSSLSLRAQLDEDHAEQEEELKVLKQQQKMLRDLIEQQKKIKELEEKQANLLRRREEAQNQLLEAEARTIEYRRLQEEAAVKEDEAEAKEQEKLQETNEDGLQLEEDVEAVERQQLMLARVLALKARKDKVESMLESLGAMQLGEDGEVGKKEDTGSVNASVEQEKEENGVSEFVSSAEATSDPKMAQVEAKLKQAAEAKKKLAELRQMIDFLKVSTGELPNEEPAQPSSEPLQWRLSLDPNKGGRGQRDVASDKEDEQASTKSLDSTLDEGGELLDQSLVADYQKRLAEKQREVAELQKQKEELKLMQEKLFSMQATYELVSLKDAHPVNVEDSVHSQEDTSEGYEDDSGLPSQLAKELKKQKDLYDEIMTKTKRLQELQNEYEEGVRGSEQDTYSLTSSTRQLTEADLTAATWGGSTAQSDEAEESDDSASAVSVPIADRGGSQQAMAGSASVKQSNTLVGPDELLNFTVTRHTPRHYPPRRTHSVSDESPQNVGKKMRLESEESLKKSPVAKSSGQTQAAGTGPSASLAGPSSHFSAVWPGVIFPSMGGSAPVFKDGMTQTASASSSTAPLNHPPNEAEVPTPGLSVPFPVENNTQQSILLQHQLALMSNMCTELLHGQNSLIHALCHRLDTSDAQASMQEHMNQLHGYHRELQMYYEEISQAHAQLTSSQQGGSNSETEDPINAHPGVGGEAEHHIPVLTSMPELSTTAGQHDHVPPTYSAPSAANEGVDSFNYGQFNPQYNSPGMFNMYGYPSMYGSPGPTPRATNEEHSETGSNPSQQPALSSRSPRPPPPLPPFVPHPPFQSPYVRPPYEPGWYSYPSPMRYPNPYSPYSFPYSPRYQHSSQQPMLGSSYGYYQWPYYGHSAYTPMVNSSTSLQEEQPAAFREGIPPHGPQFSGLQAGVGDFVLNSPSGITAASIQVEPPSTAPPSVNMQQSSSSLNNNNNNTNLSVAGGTPTSNTGTLQVPLQSRSWLGRLGQSDVSTSTSAPLGKSALGLSSSVPTLVPPVSSSSYDIHSTMASQFLRDEGESGSGDGRKEVDKRGFKKETDDLEDEESISSLPLSVPEDGQVSQSASSLVEQGQSSDQPAGFSVFDALRDTIYSEVATLIATNESRPHFLVELFRELQLLGSDYLRQRALYNIQDLVTRFLTEDGGEDKETTPTPGVQFQGWVDSTSEHTPSESEVTTEDDAPKPPTFHSTSEAFDYVELVHSASSLSTPPCTSSDQPFASEDLGETVICLDKALAKMRQEGKDVGASPGLKPPVVSPGPLVPAEEANESLEYVPLDKTELDTSLLDEQIKDIMTEVIPILKANMNSECTPQLLDQIKTTILDLVIEQENKRNPDFLEVLTKQLHATVTTAMEKYSNKKFSECGEDMLVDLSEVLFNELSFFRLMQDLRDHPQLSSDFKSVTSSQTTTENEDNGDEKQAVKTRPLPMDPLLLQALSVEANKTLVEEEESLGKDRDDELANTWDPSVQRSSMSGDEDSIVNTVDSPLVKTIGDKSAEEEGNEPVINEDTNQGPPLESSERVPPESSEVVTPANIEANIEPVTQNNSSSTPTPEDSNEDTPLVTEHENMGTTGTDSPTEPANGVAPNKSPVKDDDDSLVDSANQESGIKSVEGIQTDDCGNSDQPPASSPPGSLVTTPKSELDIQMKSEQETIEGIPGILTSIEQGQELAGDEDELPTS